MPSKVVLTFYLHVSFSTTINILNRKWKKKNKNEFVKNDWNVWFWQMSIFSFYDANHCNRVRDTPKKEVSELTVLEVICIILVRPREITSCPSFEFQITHDPFTTIESRKQILKCVGSSKYSPCLFLIQLNSFKGYEDSGDQIDGLYAWVKYTQYL